MIPYAPISGCVGVHLAEGAVEGLAYPLSGSLCCAVELVSDGRLVQASRADRFSRAAAEKGLRDGWCLFRLSPKDEDFIFSDELIIRDAVSKVAVSGITRSDWLSANPAAGKSGPAPASIDVLLNRTRRLECDPFLYWTLLDRSSHHLSDQPFLENLYTILLSRPVDGGGLATYIARLQNGLDRRTIFQDIIGSEEFRARCNGLYLSPFDQEFRLSPRFLPLSG